MKLLFSRLPIALALLSIALAPARALAEGEGPNDAVVSDAVAAAPNVDASDAFCAPGNYSRTPELCPDYGPAASSIHLQSVQLPAQIPRLDFTRIDYGNGPILKYSYARVVTSNAPVFASAEDALANANPKRRYAPGFVFVSLLGQVKEGQPVFQINPGEFMRAADLKLYLKAPSYQGIVLDKQPERPFGFILRWFRPYRIPGVLENHDVAAVDRDKVFVILDKVKVGKWYWYLVGPDMWIDQRWMAVVTPSKPPQEVAGPWIDVNIYEQTLVAYDGERMVYATLVSTGRNVFPTRPGTFKIYEKLADYKMGGAEGKADYYYLENIPYIMYFDEGRSFHGTYWHDQFGFKRSHGCVNLSPRDAEWLFKWAKVGTWVNVHDPSGQTPTDPEFYGFAASP